jgi:hypothetical protein
VERLRESERVGVWERVKGGGRRERTWASLINVTAVPMEQISSYAPGVRIATEYSEIGRASCRERVFATV